MGRMSINCENTEAFIYFVFNPKSNILSQVTRKHVFTFLRRGLTSKQSIIFGMSQVG